MRAILGLLLATVAAVRAAPAQETEPRIVAPEASATHSDNPSVDSSSLRLELVRQSLTGAHYRYRRLNGGVPMLDEFVVTREPLSGARTSAAAMRPSVFAIRRASGLRRVTESLENDPLERPVARYRDAETGALLFERPLFFDAKPGRIFDPNPVAATNDPTLQDRNDSAAAVPARAYADVTLPEGALVGPNAIVVDVQSPRIPPADPSSGLVFDRSQSGFEDVNAWFHIDRSQKHLQELGYTGVRQIAPYAVPVDAHATDGADTSYFVPTVGDAGRGTLYFGVGGTDDAEDADLVVHEYGHALLEWISPGTFAGTYNSQARALAEAITDYWAFSAHYAQRRASGRDPFCFADWDARCWEDDASQNCGYAPGTDCLRRLDASRTMADYLSAEAPGTEHWNGQIFTRALVDLFLANIARYGIAEGRRITDTLVIESLFDTPASPAFSTAAGQIVNADRLLFGGAHLEAICAAMSARGIAGLCSAAPRGEVTHYQSERHGVTIPDGDPRGVEVAVAIDDARVIDRALVRVDVLHPSRGDLRIELIAPDGTVVVLKRPSLDAARDLHTTFGREAVPDESLDVLRGKAAAGTWRLRIADTRSVDAGTLESWSLILRYAGAAPLGERPSGEAKVIPVVAHVNGANATQFRSDVRILNPTTTRQRVTLLFTPSGQDGRSEFAAVDVAIDAGRLVVLDDVVSSVFGTVGSGALAIVGDVVATSRTWTASAGGTAGQSIGIGTPSTAVTLVHLSINKDFRTNIGFTDASGAGSDVRVSLRDGATGVELRSFTIAVPPYGHVQSPLSLPPDVPGDQLIAIVEATRPVFAYASVVDNATGDGMYVEGRGSSAIPAISAAGANGTMWKTDVAIVRRDAVRAQEAVTLTFVDARSGEVSRRTLPPVPTGTAPTLRDVVAQTFMRPDALGAIAVDPSAGVELLARIYTGGFSTAVPLLEPFSGTRYLSFVEVNDPYRTNVGLMSDAGAVARLEVRDASGALLTLREIVLEPMRVVQLPLGVPVAGGYAAVRTVAGSVRAWSSVVDNRSGDATMTGAR